MVKLTLDQIECLIDDNRLTLDQLEEHMREGYNSEDIKAYFIIKFNNNKEDLNSDYKGDLDEDGGFED